jgi:hypothetical protein
LWRTQHTDRRGTEVGVMLGVVCCEVLECSDIKQRIALAKYGVNGRT